MRKGILIVLLALVLLTSCLTIDEGEVYTYSPVPAYADWAWLKSISSTIYVSLESNPSTGYEWVASIDGPSIVQTSEEYVAGYSDGLVGVPGVWNAEFEAVCDGVSTITFMYLRPWDLYDAADTMSILVTVDGGVITSVTEVY